MEKFERTLATSICLFNSRLLGKDDLITASQLEERRRGGGKKKATTSSKKSDDDDEEEDYQDDEEDQAEVEFAGKDVGWMDYDIIYLSEVRMIKRSNKKNRFIDQNLNHYFF